MFLSGKQGSSREHKHMLFEVVALEWIGIQEGLHSGNLLNMTKQTNFKVGTIEGTSKSPEEFTCRDRSQGFVP